MTVNGKSKCKAAPAPVPPKGAGRSLYSRALPVGGACPLTSGQAFTNPRRHGGGRPKGLPTRVDPPAFGGGWKVNHLDTAMKGTTYGHAVGVASSGPDSSCTPHEALADGVARCGRTEHRRSGCGSLPRAGGRAVARAVGGTPSSPALLTPAGSRRHALRPSRRELTLSAQPTGTPLRPRRAAQRGAASRSEAQLGLLRFPLGS